ncbi:MAG: hypothetical protein FJ098_16280 [Deltaproteobacteria bacterium]|nr:hypothetical protein [Deltaproteobacteria bacterium]
MRNALIAAAAALVLLSLAAQAAAQPREIRWQYPSRTRGLAGAGRSFATASNALFLNPAGLGLASQYAIEGVYSVGFDPLFHSVSTNWTDSAMNRWVAAGLGYSYVEGPDDGDASHGAHALNGGLAVNTLQGKTRLIVGLGTHWFRELKGMPKGGTRDLFLADLGVLLSVNDMFRLGVVGYNLLSLVDSRYKPALGAGASFWWKRFVFAFDVVADWDQFDEDRAGLGLAGTDAVSDFGMSYSGGIIFAATQAVMIRIGASHDQLNVRTEVAAGLSVMLPKGFGLETAYHANVLDWKDSFLSFGLQLYPMSWFTGAPE